MTKDCDKTLFRTLVDVELPLRPIEVGDRNVFLGSCFAEHVGRRFAESRLHTLINPTGVLYNPLIIARLLRGGFSLSDESLYAEGHGLWHTWLGDTGLSRLTRGECQRATEEALTRLDEALHGADNLFLTLGTSRCYTLGEGGMAVSNCHRMAPTTFRERDAAPAEIADSLGTALDALREENGRLQVVMTVSPYRYAKYGMHGSQLDKARLLLGLERLRQGREAWVNYFPAYEIVVDELRDYRFYAEDMLHPSGQAVEYVWRRLCDEWAAEGLRTYLRRWEPLGRALAHRPLHPEGLEYEAFRQRTHEQLQQLQRDYPMLEIERENEE